jgi:hypothetical protein
MLQKLQRRNILKTYKISGVYRWKPICTNAIDLNMLKKIKDNKIKISSVILTHAPIHHDKAAHRMKEKEGRK